MQQKAAAPIYSNSLCNVHRERYTLSCDVVVS